MTIINSLLEEKRNSFFNYENKLQQWSLQNDLAKTLSWSADPILLKNFNYSDNEQIRTYLRKCLVSSDLLGVIDALNHCTENQLSVWDWNDSCILLQQKGYYSDIERLLLRKKQIGQWHPLLNFRLDEATKCKLQPDYVPYFRSANFDSVNRNDRLAIDESLYKIFCETNSELIINKGSGHFSWPRSLKAIKTKLISVNNAIVLSDCSVLVDNILLYETSKAVQASWRFTHPRCNEFFGQYSSSDPWVQLVRRPEIIDTLPHAFLVPNPTEGIGHFIHDACPVLEAYEKYARGVSEPVIILRRLRDFDRVAIERLISLLFREAKIITLHPGQSVKVNSLCFSTAPFSPSQNAVSPESIKSFSSLQLNYLKSPKTKKTSKIYISRGDGQNIDDRSKLDRSIIESGLLDLAGYHIVNLSELSFDDQLEIFQSATHIAGVHGAGLMNIVFSSPGLKVTEFVVPTAANYYTISMFCAALDHDYHAINCEDIFDPLAAVLRVGAEQLILEYVSR